MGTTRATRIHGRGRRGAADRRRQAVTVRTWEAEPQQALFLNATDVDEALYGGARGGGKSDALLAFSILRRTEYAGSSGLILRRQYADLHKQGALIPRSHELLTGVATWQAQEHKWRFPNGSVLEFGHCQHDEDVYHYQGAQYDDICIDQLEQFSEWQYRVLLGALRTTRRDLKPLVRLSANPGGIGHAWVKQYFVDAAPPGEAVRDPESGFSRAFFPATINDNPHVNASYRVWLEKLPEPWRAAWRYGRWDVFAGQYFAEWRPEVHVCRSFPLPAVWRRWMAYDWGAASPAWFGWFCLAPWGTVYLYRELYLARQDESRRWVGLNLTIDQQVARALSMQAPDESASPCYTGPEMFTRAAQTGETNAMAAGRAGLAMQPAGETRGRIEGWQRIKRMLQTRMVDRLGEAVGEAVEEAGLVVFEGCRHLVRTLPLLVADEANPEDIADGQEDHAVDGARYGLAAPLPRGDARIEDQVIWGRRSTIAEAWPS